MIKNTSINESLEVVKPKHAGGRPPKYLDTKKMIGLGENYFKQCDEAKEPYTITGLSLAMGFESLNALRNYASKNKDMVAIKRLRTKVEASVEARLFKNNPTGAIFWLKNFGWTDRQDIDIKQDIVVEIIHHLPKKPIDVTPAK